MTKYTYNKNKKKPRFLSGVRKQGGQMRIEYKEEMGCHGMLKSPLKIAQSVINRMTA